MSQISTIIRSDTLSHNDVISLSDTHDVLTRRDSIPTNEQFVLESAEAPTVVLSKARTVFVIATLTGITFTSSMSTGILNIGLPRIAMDLILPENLLLW